MLGAVHATNVRASSGEKVGNETFLVWGGHHPIEKRSFSPTPCQTLSCGKFTTYFGGYNLFRSLCPSPFLLTRSHVPLCNHWDWISFPSWAWEWAMHSTHLPAATGWAVCFFLEPFALVFLHGVEVSVARRLANVLDK